MINEVNLRYTQLQNEKNDITAKLILVCKSYKIIESERNEKENEISLLSNELKDVRNKIDECQSTIDHLEDSIRQYNQSQEQVQNEINSYKSVITEKENQINEISMKFQELSKLYSTQISNNQYLANDNDLLKQKINELTQQVEVKANELKKFKSIVDSIREISSK